MNGGSPTGHDDSAAAEAAEGDGRDRLWVQPGFVLEAVDLVWRFSASGGAGGQHVNTSNTRAEVSLDLTMARSVPEGLRARLVDRLGPAVRVVASDERSQWRNRQRAQARLIERLREALGEQTPRRPTRPSKGSVRRRLDAKSRRGELKASRRWTGD